MRTAPVQRQEDTEHEGTAKVRNTDRKSCSQGVAALASELSSNTRDRARSRARNDWNPSPGERSKGS